MSEWADGYIVDIPYTTGFYKEISPTWLNFAALSNGYGSPSTKSFTYAELGCGLGHGTSLMAATHPEGEFYGFDFNPQQIGIASRLSSEAGLNNIHFLERSFEELASQDTHGLPQFDYIVLHGIWTWISETNRHHIITFISRYLKPNGIAYVSYNVNTGWMALAPIQQFMREYAQTLQGSSDRRSLEAFSLVQALSEGGGVYFKVNPSVDTRLKKALEANHRYLAHEYLNGSWYLPSHGEVRADFSKAKCQFIASATLLENIETISTPEGVKESIQKIQDPALREMAKDLSTNQGFRRDLFMRGFHRLTQLEQQHELNKLTLLPIKAPEKGEVKINTALGEITGQVEFYTPILNALFSKGGLSFIEALALPELKGRNYQDILQGFTILMHVGIAHIASSKLAKKSSDAYNNAVYRQNAAGHDISNYALPKHGTGVGVPFFEACVLETLKKNPKATDDILITEVWNHYLASARRPTKNGTPLINNNEAIEAIKLEMTPEFIKAKRLEYKQLGLLD